jgi:hypothetical protein
MSDEQTLVEKINDMSIAETPQVKKPKWLTLESLLAEKFADNLCSEYARNLSAVVSYLKEAFTNHTVVEKTRIANYHRGKAYLLLNLSVNLQDGTHVTDIRYHLEGYDICYPEDGAELIRTFELSDHFESLADTWIQHFFQDQLEEELEDYMYRKYVLNKFSRY